MAIQLYVAEDAIDGVKSYFVFDTLNTGRYICGTYDVAMLCFGDDQGLIRMVKQEVINMSWDEFNDEARRSHMLNPVLIAEW